LQFVDLALDPLCGGVVSLDHRPLTSLDQLDDLQLESHDMVFEQRVGHVLVLPARIGQDAWMATANPAPTPNPNALRFSLDVRLPDTITASSPAEAAESPFLAAVLSIDGVASVFGTADFVTVTRRPGVDWNDIVPAVQEAAAEHL
jgi:hypothetical protein